MRKWILRLFVCAALLSIGAAVSGQTPFKKRPMESAYRPILVMLGTQGAQLLCIEERSLNTLAVSCNWERFNQEYPEAHRLLKAAMQELRVE